MKFVHITVQFYKGEDVKDLSPVLDSSGEWINYAPGCWLVVTVETAESIRNRLKDQVAGRASILVMEVDAGNVWGFLPKNVWSWLIEHGGDFKVVD